jgi:adenosylcobinamide kinase/adenosylcobinamide-phosphate guanylyltransferase
MSNLVANEMYLPQGAGSRTQEAVLAGLKRLAEQTEALVIVTNEVFSDGVEYDEFTKEYLRVLGEINAAAGKWADVVVEVVCSIPIVHKGAEYVQFI